MDVVLAAFAWLPTLRLPQLRLGSLLLVQGGGSSGCAVNSKLCLFRACFLLRVLNALHPSNGFSASYSRVGG